MMSAMNDYAAMSRNMMLLKQRLNIACYAINARTAKYSKSPAAAILDLQCLVFWL